LKSAAIPVPALERRLGKLLHRGTSVAAAVIILGLIVAVEFDVYGLRIATAGIAIFILLPVARVASMAIFFWWARDYRFAAIAALVMAIIACGFVLGAN
jgi:uncharacterized membrane protein